MLRDLTPFMGLVFCFPSHSFLFENGPTENLTEDEHLPTNKAASRAEQTRTVISVPGSMLKNIRQHREEYNTYLHAVSHGVIDNFSPWVAVDR